MTKIAIIPARGGSQRIPRKNIRPFHGRPIIAYSILAAIESELFDDLFVSSDDQEILSIAMQWGAKPMLRSDGYSDDQTGTQAVMQEALRRLVPAVHFEDYACCIYPCAPLMTAHDIKEVYSWMAGRWGYGMIEGWLYWGRTDSFLSGLPLMESCCSWKPTSRYVDINTPEDWEKAEKLYAALRRA